MTLSKNMKRTIAGLMISAFAAVAPAFAQETRTPNISDDATAQQVMLLSSGVYLAYVVSPSAVANDESQRGLTMLANTMTMKTAIEPKGVIGIDFETITAAELACLPFIYYPVTPETGALSAQARSKLQTYIDNGGMVMIDTRDYGAVTQNARDLRPVMGTLNLRPLVHMPLDHTLTKSFFLSTLPGTTQDGAILVEQPGAKGSEIVSSVIIGGRNWAGAWAGSTLQDMSRDHEMALRSGVNIIMYAITGNYKSDQTHIPAIMERLGK